jgi:hypothetical protein
MRIVLFSILRWRGGIFGFVMGYSRRWMAEGRCNLTEHAIDIW